MKSKVFLVDDHPALRQGLRIFIDTDEDLTVCGEADNVNDAVKMISDIEPDIIIVDLSFNGELAGLDLIKAVAQRFPEIYMLVLSMHDENAYAERCLRAGAHGYIMKNEAQEKIIVAIKRILSNKFYLSEAINDALVGKMVHGTMTVNDEIVDVLTDKEFEIFKLLGEGHSAREIAHILNLTRNTIDSHRRNIREKLHFKTSSELLRKAVQWSLAQE